MRYVVMSSAAFPTTNARNRCRNDISARVAGLTTALPSIVADHTDRAGNPALRVDVSCFTDADMQSLYSAAFAFLEQRGWSAGRLHWHICDHDGGGGPCQVGGEAVK